MRNVMLDTHQYLIAMEEPLFAGPARRLYLQSRHLPWLYRMLVGAREIAIRSAARHIPVLVGEWCVENRWALHGRNRADAYRQVSRLQRAAWDASAGQVCGATSLRVPRNQAAAKENRHVTRATAAISKHGI